VSIAVILKRVAKWLGVAVIALVVLFVGLLSFVKYQETVYDKRALPFLAVVMADLATWDHSKILPHFAEPVASSLPEEDLRALLSALSRLGDLRAYEKPDFRGVHTGANIEDGAYKFVIYLISATFENGGATVTIKMRDAGGRLSIYSLNVDSPVVLGTTSSPILDAVSVEDFG
jgi:hypothetical protein